jgi:hypothetical protein
MILTSLNIIIIYYLFALLIKGGSLEINPLFYLVIGITTLDGLYRLKYVEHLHPIEILIRVLVFPFSIYMLLYQTGLVRCIQSKMQ